MSSLFSPVAPVQTIEEPKLNKDFLACQRMHIDGQCHWKQIQHDYFQPDPVTKIAPWYVNIIPAHRTGFKIRAIWIPFHIYFPSLRPSRKRSQQLFHYYSINIADILKDNWKNSILVGPSLTRVLPQTRNWSTPCKLLIWRHTMQ